MFRAPILAFCILDQGDDGAHQTLGRTVSRHLLRPGARQNAFKYTDLAHPAIENRFPGAHGGAAQYGGHIEHIRFVECRDTNDIDARIIDDGVNDGAELK